MNNDILVYLGIGFVFLICPLILTVLNIINLFKKKKIKENIIEGITFIAGIGLTGFLYPFSCKSQVIAHSYFFDNPLTKFFPDPNIFPVLPCSL